MPNGTGFDNEGYIHEQMLKLSSAWSGLITSCISNLAASFF